MLSIILRRKRQFASRGSRSKHLRCGRQLNCGTDQLAIAEGVVHMRIGMLCPLEIRVPPTAYGGIELVVSLLTEELVRRGHEVTLFASGDSETAARLESVVPRSLRGTDHHRGTLELLNVVECLGQADRFDIIHNHVLVEGMAAAALVDTPFLTTLHGGLDGDFRLLFEHYTGWYNAISRSAFSLLPPKERSAGVIYNAIDYGSYPFNSGIREDHILFLSRISQEKGPHIAIEVARKLGVRLVLAGNVDDPDREFFETQILPQVDGGLIQYVGEADSSMKRDLLSRARCLIAPLTWEEPFGLFMIEAMACGTPVVAFNRGAAPEVVQDGVTGFIVDTVDEMAEAIGQVHHIDPATCRAHVERRFNVARMVDEYLAAYGIVAERYAPVSDLQLRLDSRWASPAIALIGSPSRRLKPTALAPHDPATVGPSGG